MSAGSVLRFFKSVATNHHYVCGHCYGAFNSNRMDEFVDTTAPTTASMSWCGRCVKEEVRDMAWKEKLEWRPLWDSIKSAATGSNVVPFKAKAGAKEKKRNYRGNKVHVTPKPVGPPAELDLVI